MVQSEPVKPLNISLINGLVGNVVLYDKAAKVSINTGLPGAGGQEWITVTILTPSIITWLRQNNIRGKPVTVQGKAINTQFKRGQETVYGIDVIATTFNVFDLLDGGSENQAVE